MINCFHKIGLCISYRRLLEILTSLSNSHIAKYVENNIVCLPNMKKGFVTGVCFDNIDQNSKSTTSRATFHGTAITTNQYIPINTEILSNEEVENDPVYANSSSIVVNPLPKK